MLLITQNHNRRHFCLNDSFIFCTWKDPYHPVCLVSGKQFFCNHMTCHASYVTAAEKRKKHLKWEFPSGWSVSRCSDTSSSSASSRWIMLQQETQLWSVHPAQILYLSGQGGNVRETLEPSSVHSRTLTRTFRGLFRGRPRCQSLKQEARDAIRNTQLHFVHVCFHQNSCTNKYNYRWNTMRWC